MNKIDSNPIFVEMGFNLKWIESGIINDDIFLSLQENYLNPQNGDIGTEHYRWAAFKSFLDSNSQISKHIFYTLYDLGENEPYYPVRNAIIFEIIGRPECPMEIIETAINDDYSPLSKYAIKCKSSRVGTAHEQTLTEQ